MFFCRILGVQLLESADQGIHVVESPVSRPSTGDSQTQHSSNSYSDTLNSNDRYNLLLLLTQDALGTIKISNYPRGLNFPRSSI